MWNKRRDEEPPKPFKALAPQGVSPVTASAPALAPSPVEVKKEMTPVSSTPVARFEADSSGRTATIGKSVRVVGQIFANEDLFVDGTVEGTLEALSHKITIGPHGAIGPNGTVESSIKAREVVAMGTIQGNVEASERLEIRKDAKLQGKISTARIIIEDGAYFKGSIDIIKPEPVKAAPKQPAAAPAAPAAAPSPAAAPAAATEFRR